MSLENEIVNFTTSSYWRAVRKMTALRQVHTKHRVANLKPSIINSSFASASPIELTRFSAAPPVRI